VERLGVAQEEEEEEERCHRCVEGANCFDHEHLAEELACCGESKGQREQGEEEDP